MTAKGVKNQPEPVCVLKFWAVSAFHGGESNDLVSIPATIGTVDVLCEFSFQ